MSVPGYESYRDSGVEWLGEVPSHWSVGKFRHQFRESAEKIDAEVVGPMLSVSGYRGIEIKEYDDENRRRLDEELVGYRIVRPGQLVVNTMWLNYAGLGVSAHEGHVSPAYRSYWVLPSLDGRYAHHLMRSSIYVQGYTRLLTGIRPNSLQMSRDDLMEFPVIVAPLAEQTAIAGFLDRETGKIDALVETQRGLIELLKEKRQAVISHVVTKGLDPTAPTKDSGVEWLGHVPAHWEIVAVKRLARLQSGEAITATDIEESGTYPVFGGNGLRGFTESFTHEGDFVLIGRQGALCGNINYAQGRFWASEHAIVAHPRQLLHTRWFGELLRTMNLGQYSVAAAQPGLSADALGNLHCPRPPIDEQADIAQALYRLGGTFDPLIAEANAAISLLLERRSALISAAVTGKIDVRGLAPEQAAAA